VRICAADEADSLKVLPLDLEDLQESSGFINH